MRLSRRTISPVPLYFKVMTEIRDNILSGTWSRGFQLPGELDLARRLGVSVITVRQALATTGSREACPARARQRDFRHLAWTRQQLLGTERIEPGAELQRVFKLSGNERITRMIRVRMAQGRLLAYVHSYIGWTVAAKLSPRSLLKLPLSSAMESRLGIRITDLKHLVGAKLVDAVILAHLQIPAGSPVLLSRETISVKSFAIARRGLLSHRSFSLRT